MIGKWLQKVFTRNSLLPSFGKTDIGQVRPNNEDRFFIISGRNIFIVADGMGGHRAGETASKVAIETLEDFFSKSALRSVTGKKAHVQHFMISGLRYANDEVIRVANSSESMRGMGCTLVAAFIDGQTIHICHVGDVRCYRANNENLEQITTDHTELVQAKSAGSNASEDETFSMSRHGVTRAMGFEFDEDPEYHEFDLLPGNKILLCSDGLWSMVDDTDIYATLKGAASPEEAANNLVGKANEAGGKDNITALVIYC